MNNKPEIADPESDAVALLGCLDSHSPMHGLLHRHAVSVLVKYDRSAELARQIIETSQKPPKLSLLSDVRQLLYNRVFVSGTEEENLGLFVEAFDEDDTDYAA